MRIELTNGILFGFPLNILIENERIVSISRDSFPPTRTIDLQNKIILPGMIDLHVHVRDLNNSNKEDWTSASDAALKGGVTSIFDMPNTNPATVDYETYKLKLNAAQISKVNYGCYIGCSPTNYEEVKNALLQTDSIPALKIFLSASSANEVIEDENLLEKFLLLAKEYNKTVLFHSESQKFITRNAPLYSDNKYNHCKYHSLIRNRESAIESTKLILKLARKTNARIHILHVGTMEEIQLIREYKRTDAGNVYCETTPHHLFLNDIDVEQFGNYAKVNPPIRSIDDNEALLEALADNTIDTIGSDHAPHTIEEKQRDYRTAPSGFPGLETSLPLLISNLYHKHNFTLDKISELISKNPAKILDIKDRGEIKVGAYADLTIIDLQEEVIVNPLEFSSKAKYSPYSGMKLKGKVLETMVNGKFSQSKGKLIEYDQN